MEYLMLGLLFFIAAEVTDVTFIKVMFYPLAFAFIIVHLVAIVL